MKMITKILIGIATVFLILIIIVVITQLIVSTPQILDETGKPLAGSIAELTKVEVNGRKEWLCIRGRDENAPILLYLAGGPGGTQMTGTRFELEELEKHFVVIGWDQPGSGKSYNCMNQKQITVDTYIEDGIAVTKYLQERFGSNRFI